VNDIVKQKFLAELGKLLTFMYEEDRQTALAMYGKMFDDAHDERDLVQFLGSPTRQAVVVARTYNARVRKLQVESQSRQQDGAEPEITPDFVLAIDDLYQQYFPGEDESSAVLANQFSLFEETPAAAPDPVDFHPVTAAPQPQAVTSAEAVRAVAETVEELETASAAQGEPALSTVDAVEEVFDAAPAESALTRDEVDSFLADFNIPEEELAEDGASPQDEEEPMILASEEDEVFVPQDELVLVRKPRVFLLILFVLLAVPLTLAGVVLLLIPTLLFLALAAACIVAGAALLVAAFSGFKILADFLLLFGAAIILLALGLLFLWIFVWFIGGAIAGLIAGVIGLGGRWCYKEVAA